MMKPKHYLSIASIFLLGAIVLIRFGISQFNEQIPPTPVNVPHDQIVSYPPVIPPDPKIDGRVPSSVSAIDTENPKGFCVENGNAVICSHNAASQVLRREDFFFNAPNEMQLSVSESIALVIDTTGKADSIKEMTGLSGEVVFGEVQTSMIMEAELVGSAFEIKPSGRQKRFLSRLNPTRWDWEITPKRAGQHQLEVSLYIISDEGKGEEKPIAERRIIDVTVSTLDSFLGFLSKLDPLISFIATMLAGIAAVLAWFGISSWKDVSKKTDE